MRYIEKQNTEPACLSEYKVNCRKSGVQEPLLYKDFNNTGKLRQVLCLEQHNVCCYCQRPVNGFRIEHSYPEHGPDNEKSKHLQLDYTNLFASCIDSQRYSTYLQHCDVAKGNQIIREFIKEEKCQTYFRYLSTGEIIPNGRFCTLKEYEEADDLNDDEKEALDAIKVLNLNCITLVEDRKCCLTELLRTLTKRSKEEWRLQIDRWLFAETFPPYIELRLQFLTQYLRDNYKLKGTSIDS